MKSKRKPLAEELLDELKNELFDLAAKFDAGTVRIIEPQDRQKTRDPEQLGWTRLLKILMRARQDESIRASVSALSYLDHVTNLACVAGAKKLNKKVEFDEEFGSITVFRPLGPTLTSDKLRDNTGRIKGRDTMERLKEAHIEHLRKPVIDLLKNPQTSDWSDPEIARWLMKPERAYHERKGKTPLGLKTMTTRVKEIRAAYKASI